MVHLNYLFIVISFERYNERVDDYSIHSKDFIFCTRGDLFFIYKSNIVLSLVTVSRKNYFYVL